MRAVAIREFGGPSVLTVSDVIDPQPSPGSVLIDVDAAGVNFGDVLVRQGQYFGGHTLPLIPGWEVVGRVADPGDSAFRRGQRVVAILAEGGYAERVAAPVTGTVAVPDEVSDQVALSMVIQGVTAWRVLETPVACAPGDVVLISGGGSGVTHMAVQLARLRHVERVVVVCSDEGKAAIVQALGAEPVVCPDGGTLADTLLAEVGAGRADHVIDMVGSPVFDAMLPCLRPGGRAVVFGAAGGRPAKISSGALLRFGWTVAGLWLGHDAKEPLPATLGRLYGLHRAGHVRPTLGPTLALDDAADAHRLVEARRAVGKIMLTCR